MHPYIPHLLDDILNAHRPMDFTVVEEPMSFEEEMEAIENWVEQEAEHSFGYHCGLDPVNFPPHEQLNVKDIRLVNHAFRTMMYSWNLAIDLPAKMPARLVYTFLVNCLNEKVPIVESGTVNIDYCTGNPADCCLKKYCFCRNSNMKEPGWRDDDLGDTDLPF